MDGELVFLPHQLDNGSTYVAASREKFRDVEYVMGTESFRGSVAKS